MALVWLCRAQLKIIQIEYSQPHIKRLAGVATIVQGMIVKGDSCPWNCCPMTQMSKEKLAQIDLSFLLLEVAIFIDYRMPKIQCEQSKLCQTHNLDKNHL